MQTDEKKKALTGSVVAKIFNKFRPRRGSVDEALDPPQPAFADDAGVACPSGAPSSGPPVVSIEPISESAKRQSLLKKRVVEGGYLVIGRRGSLAELDHDAKTAYLVAEGAPYTISKRHCRIEIKDDEVWLVDLGSRSGTRIDGERLGTGVGGPSKVRLERGVHTLIPGQRDSAFVFSVAVE